MPVGKALPERDIAAIEAWIKNLPTEITTGKQEWRWPFQKPIKPEVPSVKNGSWARNPIDSFIAKRLEDKNLSPGAQASKQTLARRVYFDLIGLPPTPEEIKAYEKDTSADAYEKLIDRLLNDPRYGERWARHWLDLVRYGETSGLEGDGAIGNAWRYRDWVIDAFNADMPYDRFVLLQLAGADEHSKTRNNYQPNPQGYIPLGFLRVAPWDRSNLVAAEVRANYLAEITATAGSVFLGLSVGCARCHDHKYDPISQRDYYRFQSFFNAIQVENVEVPYKDEEFAAKANKRISEYQDRLKDGPEQKALQALDKESLVKFIDRKKKAAVGQPLSVADLRLELRRTDRRVFTVAESRRHTDLLEDATRTQDPEERSALDIHEKELMPKLIGAYSKPGFDDAARFDMLNAEELQKELANSKSKIFSEEEREKHREVAEQVQVLKNRLNRWKPVALTVKNVSGPPSGPDVAPVRVLARGDYRSPGEAVEPGFLSCLNYAKTEAAVIEQDRYRQFPTRGWRITLAKWITNPENPLVARVMVNRIWQHHFGRGIVGTPSDFGVNGERPTHPELLDWLAHKFIEEKWSIKALHRLMLTSATYRQSAENPSVKDSSPDPENKLLWHFPRRRLEAEEIRDSILFLSGRLNPEWGGPSVFPPLPDDLQNFARYGREGGIMWEPNEKEEDGRRRSIYAFQRRSMPLPMMAAFDSPVFSESCERRSTTTTPLQALSMINGNLLQEESVFLAKRIEKEVGSDRQNCVAQAFEIVLNRPPSAEESKHFAAFGGNLAALCRVLLNSNEFLYVE